MKKAICIILMILLLSNLMLAQQADITKQTTKKRNVKNMFMSLLVPGLGQVNNDKPVHAAVFVIAEIFAWGTMYYFDRAAERKDMEYKRYAMEHAGVPHMEQDYSFWYNVGKYRRWDNEAGGYNEEIWYTAISSDNGMGYWYTNRYKAEEGQTWKWRSESERDKYNTLHSEKSDLDKMSDVTMGLILLNHVISAIHAGISGKSESPVSISADIKEHQKYVQLDYRF